MVSPRADRRLAGVVLVLAAAVLALAGAARTQTLNVAALVKGTNGSLNHSKYAQRRRNGDVLRQDADQGYEHRL